MDYTIDFTALTQYDNLEFIAKQVVEGFITGLHKSPLHGFSVEFAEHRQYNPGEPTKHIDWKLYANGQIVCETLRRGDQFTVSFSY